MDMAPLPSEEELLSELRARASKILDESLGRVGKRAGEVEKVIERELEKLRNELTKVLSLE